MSTSSADLSQLSINAIRTLSMDGVQAANSGHPGTPMALAPLAYTIWNHALKFDPSDPSWPARDRFVLSCGHASMLLYSMLHLAGVKRLDADGKPGTDPAVSLADLRQFRQLGTPCAGHPEWGEVAGIETTTGPLGQGIATSVGMALSSRWLSAHYARPGFELFDFDVYVVASDGDLMEGIGAEAASLAGHLKLSNLCWFYDDNRITIEGNTDLAFSEDIPARFRSLGWNTVLVEDANDLASLQAAVQTFRETDDRPTLVVVRSVIAWGSPHKAGTAAAHGAPLGEEEVLLTKQAYGWPPDDPFFVPEGVREHFSREIGSRGGAAHSDWRDRFGQYANSHPDLAQELKTMWSGELPAGWDAEIATFPTDDKGLATRASSGQVLNQIAARVPWMLGGSADLAPSNNTTLTGDQAGEFSESDYGGRNFHFGVREHAMAAACNGMSLCHLRPYAGTFFCFTDYMRPAIRLASMMRRGVLYILTHDSIGLGEDGPTHQPVEHLAACRAIPDLLVMRPGDANEVAAAYRVLVGQNQRPAALVLTRQAVPTLDRGQMASADGVARGGYVLVDAPHGAPQIILVGSGSELSLCVAAHRELVTSGIAARVVSLPCWELFEDQDSAYRETVLPQAVTARVGVEAGIRQGWDRYLGRDGQFVGMASFGASGKYQALYEHFGITTSAVVAAAHKALTA
ncbi:MAG: transketolase [Planctomycetaceae bacterium]|nr:transketolase [Planctomycetaceae bacterium]